MSDFLVSVRVEKSKKPAQQKAHDFDDRPAYADASKSHLNKTILGGVSDEISARISSQSAAVVAAHDNYVSEQKKREPVNARRYQKWSKRSSTHIQGVITFSRAVNLKCSGNTDLSRKKLAALDKKALEFLDYFCQKNGCKPTYLVRHGDETSPHYHFMTTGYNETTHKPIRFKKSDLSALQDDAGAVFGKIGVQRGKKIAERLKNGSTNVIHRSVKQLHADLPVEIAELERKKKLLEQDRAKAQSRLEATQAKLARAELDEAALTILQSRFLTYEKRVNSKQAELALLESKINDLETSCYELETRTNELTEQRIDEGVKFVLNHIKQEIRTDAVKNYGLIMQKLAQQRSEQAEILENKQRFEEVVEDHVDDLFNNFRMD